MFKQAEDILVSLASKFTYNSHNIKLVLIRIFLIWWQLTTRADMIFLELIGTQVFLEQVFLFFFFFFGKKRIQTGSQLKLKKKKKSHHSDSLQFLIIFSMLKESNLLLKFWWHLFHSSSYVTWGITSAYFKNAFMRGGIWTWWQQPNSHYNPVKM